MKFRFLPMLAAAVGVLLGSGHASADTKVVCENLNLRGQGYLLIEDGIIAGSSCPNGKYARWSTPYNGLVIIAAHQLEGLIPPYAGVKVQAVPGKQSKVTIKQVVDGLVACSAPVVRPAGFFTKPYGRLNICNQSGTVPDSVTYYQHVWVELARPAGKPGELRVKLNSNYVGVGRNYTITTTSSLHGGTTTIIKNALTASKNYTIGELGPDFLAQAKQGATFTFKVELFEGIASAARYTMTATGQEMVKN
ncbi:hypothetical protein IB234_19220 [Pseudomonas sp. PDM16]|uniref:hypothetical protein n=1 Tax=Pseudomonas sp. PDM16 TaxID=2769292 RepID=UPI001786072F|nr:hypothetical protein [Pseudomonas sp. PDM16]MBD9416700.1 hypothetical protein [Pseudomonas sp. PDM16]